MADYKKLNAVAQPESKELPRVLGLVDVIGIVIGSVIGSGIFIVPAAIAAQVKSPLLIFAVWLVGGILSFFGALSFAELGAAFPQAGGMYVYLREAYGSARRLFVRLDPVPGHRFGNDRHPGRGVLGQVSPYFFPLTPLATKLISIVLIAFLAAVNFVGVRWGALLQNLLTLVKVAAVIGMSAVIFVFARGDASHFASPSPPPFSWNLAGAFGVALVASLWAYKGWEAVTFSAGEIRNPQRNLPLGLLAGTALIAALYIVANLAYLYVLPGRGDRPVGPDRHRCHADRHRPVRRVGRRPGDPVLDRRRGQRQCPDLSPGLFRHGPRPVVLPEGGRHPPPVPHPVRVDFAHGSVERRSFGQRDV